MSFTYDPSTPLGQVRLYIGDTVSTNAVLTDADINGLLAVYTSPISTAVALCYALAGKYSRAVSFSVEGLSISNSQKSDHYLNLAKELRYLVGSDGGADPAGLGGVGAIGDAFVGGTSQGEMTSVDEDTDRTESAFEVGKFDEKRSER